MPFTNPVFDLFMGPGFSELKENNTEEVSSIFQNNRFWVDNFILNSVFGGSVTKDTIASSLFILRRAESAFSEYKVACNSLQEFIISNPKSHSVYLKTLIHFELVISMTWQAYMLLRKVTGEDFYIVNDGSVWERCNLIYNTFRHFDPTSLDSTHVQSFWLTNQGVHTESHSLTFSEIRDLLIDLGHRSDELSKAGK